MRFSLNTLNPLYSLLKGTLLTYGVHKSTCPCVRRPPTLLILASSVSLFASNRFWLRSANGQKSGPIYAHFPLVFHECSQYSSDTLSRQLSHKAHLNSQTCDVLILNTSFICLRFMHRVSLPLGTVPLFFLFGWVVPSASVRSPRFQEEN